MNKMNNYMSMPLEMLLGAASNLLKFADKLGNENKAEAVLIAKAMQSRKDCAAMSELIPVFKSASSERVMSDAEIKDRILKTMDAVQEQESKPQTLKEHILKQYYSETPKVEAVEEQVYLSKSAQHDAVMAILSKRKG